MGCSVLLVGNTGYTHVGCGFLYSLFVFLNLFLVYALRVPVGGAVLEDGDGTDLAQVYNPKTAVWTEVAPMQIARSGSAACTLKGKIYIIGTQHTSH